MQHVLIKRSPVIAANFKLWYFASLRFHSSKYYDVIISGFGPIGGSMSCGLGLSRYFEKKKILLLESQRRPTESFNYDQPFSNQVCAISPGSRTFIESLGIWDNIKRKCPVKKMQIWDALSNSSILFDDDNMTSDLCYIIENHLIVSGIREILDRLTSRNFEIIYDTRITTLTLPEARTNNENHRLENVHVTLKGGQELECSLLIAADGANSVIPAKANIPKISWEYNQMAIVATVKLDKPTENVVAWQRFLPEGPVALLPLDESHSSLVWSTSTQSAKELMSLSEELLVKEINDAFYKDYHQKSIVTFAEKTVEEILSTINPGQRKDPLQTPPSITNIRGKPASFPLGLSHSSYYVKPRLALIGDTAHRIHPLAGQGANLGFRDVSCLLDVLERAVCRGQDIGSLSHLMQFESERQLNNVAFSMATDCINKVYATESEPVILLRFLGLMGAAASGPFKELLKKQAMM